MKQRLVFVYSLAMALMLCSCTPGGYIDIQEFWTATNNDAQMTSLTERQADRTYVVPQTATVQTKTTDTKTSLNVQAQVVMPRTTNIPVLQIEPRTIDQAFVDNLIDVFAKGKPVYERPMVITYFATKENAQKILGQMEDELNNPDSSLSQLKDLDPEGYALFKKLLEEKIQEAQAFLNSPDNGPPQLADTSFALKPSSVPVEPEQYKSMWFAQEPDVVYEITLEQYGANTFCFLVDRMDGKSNGPLTDHFYESTTEDLPSAGIGYQEAETQARQIVSDMGADYMDLAFSGKGRYGYVDPNRAYGLPMDEYYVFMFTRSYNDVREHIQRGGYFIGGIQLNDYEAKHSWRNEYLTVCIDKEGLRSVEWQSPSTLVKVVNENVALAPFEQVVQTLEDEGVIYLRALNWTWHQKQCPDTFNIDRISLGLYKIVDPQEEGKYLLIPSWRLSGAYVVDMPEDDWDWDLFLGHFDRKPVVYTQVKYQFKEQLPLIDYMEINALDANILEKKRF